MANHASFAFDRPTRPMVAAMGGELEIDLTIDMIRAGVDAYLRWNADDEEPVALVVEVFYAMLKAASPLR